MAPKKKTELQQLSEFIRDHMATKDDLAELREEMVTKAYLAEQLATELDPIKKTLAEHTTDLNIIKGDVKQGLDKRLQLDVRVTNLEKKVFGASQEPARQ